MNIQLINNKPITFRVKNKEYEICKTILSNEWIEYDQSGC